MTACPECGAPPQAITQNADTGADVYEDENGHIWQDPDDSDLPSGRVIRGQEYQRRCGQRDDHGGEDDPVVPAHRNVPRIFA